MPAADIVVKGAREHNLRSVDVSLPRNKLICLTGVSGSGKSSLAFDTLYAEGQRRYVESLSSFARQFLGQMPKPDVDLISGLSPSISISQKTSGQNPRSTVGTITEIYDYLRVLYARTGTGHCPRCSREITAQTADQIIARVADLPEGTRYSVLAPLIRGQKGEYRDLFEDLLKQGFVRARVDGNIVQLTDDLQLDRQMRHNIEVVVDRLVSGRDARGRLAEAVELALKLGEGNLIVAMESDGTASAKAAAPAPKRTKRATPNPESRIPSPESPAPSPQSPTPDLALSAHYACTHCGLSFEPPSPQLFSFNSPQGMCKKCVGLGEFYSFDPALLVPNDKLSMRKGAFELLGAFDDMGRWKRHIYDGVAETMERKLGLDEGTLLGTPWRDLDPKLRDIWLWGTGDEHITFTWRKGNAPMMWGGKFEGLVPELMEKHGSTGSKMQRRQLEKYMSVVKCPECCGERLNAQARSVRLTSRHGAFIDKPSRTLPEVCAMAISDATAFFAEIELDATRAKIAEEALKEIRGRLGFLINVGLEYLMLDRTAPTLSGGESQRIRLAGQIGCGLVGVLYILDEPSIGLHPRDNDRLLGTLYQLRDLGNTVVVVEHDEDTMRAADHLIDFGPGPGVRGGEVVANGSLDDVRKATKSVTAKFLTGERKIEIPAVRRQRNGKAIHVIGARHNNLKNVDAEIPLGCFVCVTGVSGSGKSSLVNDILVEALHRDLNRGEGQPGHFDRIDGIEHLDKLIAIDQSPIGRTPRSNPSTYIKLFDDIRDLYVQLPQSKQRGYKPGRFSFNVAGGRCEACEGNGSNKLEMDFLADVWVTCPVCEGKRFNRETLQVHFKGKSIADVLEMDVQQALEHFQNVPSVRHKLQTLHDVGLDYIKLGQPSPTLSGGEAQRVKLARELVKKSTGKTMYLLDEPTTGLHFADIEMLLKVLHNFVDAGNTVLVVEHNLDVLKTADWLIDIGPEGGAGGGQIIATGTPEDVAQVEASHTGRSLKKVFEQAVTTKKPRSGESPDPRPLTPDPRQSLPQLSVRGARQHNLKSIDVTIPRDAMTVCCGMSGSGKTSLAMDTIYAEGQRRYVESLSSYARQFVGQMQKPQLDHIEGLSPAIAIEQKNMGHTPRSTVGTVTEVYDYLRILFARMGEPFCPDCDITIGTQSADEVIDKIVAEPAGTKALLCAPVDIQVGEKYETLWEDLRADGYARVRVDGQTHSLDVPPTIDRRRKHDVEVVIDRIVIDKGARSRIAGSVENALAIGKGVCKLVFAQDDVPEPRWQVKVHSQHYACDKCGRSFEPLTPHHFSFNSSIGWCDSCQGLGTQTGANPAALLNSSKLTLAEGAIAIWPAMGQPIADTMVRALAGHAGLPLDRPFDQLSARQRRIIMHGLGEDWIGVYPPNKSASDNVRPVFRFQYKGLYPALEEASRLSPSLRSRLEHLVGEVECSMCGGSRLRDDSSAVRFRGRTIDETCRLPLGKLLEEVRSWKLAPRERKIAGEVLREVVNRVSFLVDVGLEYLTLGRPTPTLSGGEAQRIRLAAQVGSGLCGVLYVLDEPTIGLHPRDNRRLLDAMKKLRDLGNTLLVVEHDRDVIAEADALLDFGPKAGEFGGEIVASGSPSMVAKQKGSVTGPYISGEKAIGIPKNRRVAVEAITTSEAKARGLTKATLAKSPRPAPRAPSPAALEIIGARHNNLRNVSVSIPLGTLTAVAGVSGSGKSSLIEDVLYNALARTLHRAATTPGPHDAIRGLDQINKVIRVDQQPLGNSPSSNPATYTGVFELVRQLFSQLPDAKVRGFTARRFSFNVPGGRCEACEGNGQKKIEMHFLPDVWVECEACRGRRYNEETLAVRFHGQSIADVLDMSCGRAVKLFEHIPRIRSTLQLLCDVGLDYVKLGQPAPTLSGGEAQRVKLAAELARPDTGRTLYLLDEPTTGLHFEDLAKLLDVLNRLVDLGNTVVVIEHNLDVLKTADWIIEIGPEAGDDGGLVVATGTPEQIVAHSKRWKAQGKNGSAKKPARTAKPAKQQIPDPRPLTPDPCLRSYTGEALAPVLAAGPYIEREEYDFAAAEERRKGDLDISQVGREAKMPWEVDGRRWHTVEAVDRRGKPVRWEGKVLAEVVDRIHALGKFSDTNWNERSVVEIAAEKKSDGWFFHAITGESWILKLKFRTAKSTFNRDKLIADLALQPYNELPDLPVYGNEPRVKCKNQRGPFQEIEIHAHSWTEIDTPAFWHFVERAVKGFESYLGRAASRPDDIMPWKVLGQKWHFARKGFPPGKRVEWEPEVLEELCEMLSEVAPEGQFLWNNQQLVHVFVPGQKEPWASVMTKKPQAVELVLNGPKNQFAYGQVLELGCSRDFDTSPKQCDQIKVRFRTKRDLTKADFADFLRKHRATIGDAVAISGN
jgi:excinuclease ABC subunit A